MFCAAVATGQSSLAPAPLHLLTDYPSAKCLDGSPGAYYHRPALNASDASKWVFSLQGGGECVDEAGCKDRADDKSNTSLGSSVGYVEDGSLFMEQFQNGYEQYNPDFYSWNHVLVMYCTGDLHLGTVEAPGDDQWRWAYFTGGLVVDAVLADLQARADLQKGANPGAAYNLDAADLVVWSGDSAGGIGSAAQVDHAAEIIRRMQRKRQRGNDELSSSSSSTGVAGEVGAGEGGAANKQQVRVVGAPIAGFYWNNSHPYNASDPEYVPFDADAFAQYMTLWQMRVPAACAAAYPTAPHVCGLLNFSLPTVASEVYVIEMLVDSVQQSLHGGVPAYDDATAPYVTQFGRNMTRALRGAVMEKDTRGGRYGRTGLFAPACYAHTAFYSARPLLPPGENTNNVFTTFADWLFGRGQFDDYLIDDCCSTSDTAVTFNPSC
jgi:hypothetical protein